MGTAITYKKGLELHAGVQPKWMRIVLLSVLGYEGAGGIAGGILLLAAPDGHLMDMPVDIMHGAFRDFFIPGLILLALGVLNGTAFFSVLRKSRYDWLLAGLAMGGFLAWFVTEIALLEQFHWLHAMWGLPVVAGALAAVPLIAAHTTLQRALLVCGILSSVLYVALNIFIPLLWKEYDPASQTVSELSAVHAPTRLIWVVLCTPYTLLVTAFGWGVRKAAGENRKLRITGTLLLIYGALGVLWPFAPMHLRETLAAGGATFSDTMHIALGVVTELLFFLAMGFAAFAFGKRFRLYTIVTFLVILLFGVLTFLGAPGVAANAPTPLLGTWERINIGVFLLWIVVLALVLLRRETQPAAAAMRS